MEYNSTREKLVLPEYGRHIQNMVRHAMTITDREERNRCAQTIISIMGNMFPHLRDVNDFKHKLWDHLAIMSDFKLDIDYPYEVPKASILEQHHDKIPYRNSQIRYRHYGATIEELIRKAAEMDDEEEQSALLTLVANHMKKMLLEVNKDLVDDSRILNDIKALSDGRIDVDPDRIRILDFAEMQRMSMMSNQRKSGNLFMVAGSQNQNQNRQNIKNNQNRQNNKNRNNLNRNNGNNNNRKNN